MISATNRAVANASTGMDQGDAAVVAQDVIKEVVPVVVNQANAEPWYQSRVTWGAILAALTGILGVFGYAFPAEMQGKVIDALVAAGPIVSALIVLYGRWIAKKPLGA